MPVSDLIRRRPGDSQPCPACGSPVPPGSAFCPSCGVRTDDPDAQPLHIVDRATGLFNERFIRPVLEDELARAHRYGRFLGVLLVEAHGGKDDSAKQSEEVLKALAQAVAGTLRDVDTPGVLSRRPPQLLAVLPDTDIAGTGYAATRVLGAVSSSLNGRGEAAVGLVCVLPSQRVRGSTVIEAAAASLRSGRPELLGR
jgi:GGDEF domain-containing protein